MQRRRAEPSLCVLALVLCTFLPPSAAVQRPAGDRIGYLRPQGPARTLQSAEDRGVVFELGHVYAAESELGGTPLPAWLHFPSTGHVARAWRQDMGRHLQPTEAALLNLFGGVETLGLYYTTVYLGTPPQPQNVMIDTGSDLFWTQCASCGNSCLTGDSAPPSFDESKSTTIGVPTCATCNGQNQVCVGGGCKIGCKLSFNDFNFKQQCSYFYEYADQSATGGQVYTDVLSLDGTNSTSNIVATVLFGCDTQETGGQVTSPFTNGLMGLGRGILSVPSQVASNGTIADAFSVCMGGLGGGYMAFGTALKPPTGLSYTPFSTKSTTIYAVEFKDITVSGASLRLSTLLPPSSAAIIDTGTTFTYLPQAVVTTLQAKVSPYLKKLQQLSARDVASLFGSSDGSSRVGAPTACYILPSSGDNSTTALNSFGLPTVDFVFNGANLTLGPEGYMFIASAGTTQGSYDIVLTCFAILPSEASINASISLMGELSLRDHFILFDRVNEQIGFVKANCSQGLPPGSEILPNATSLGPTVKPTTSTPKSTKFGSIVPSVTGSTVTQQPTPASSNPSTVVVNANASHGSWLARASVTVTVGAVAIAVLAVL